MSAVVAHRVAHLVLATAVAASLGACSDGQDSPAPQRSADGRRYCELTAEVEAQAEEAFSTLAEDATEDQVAEAQRRLLETVDAELAEMIEAAPPEIAADVEAYVAFFRSQMRNEATDEVSDERIVDWEETNCPADAS